jgi:hypothetical protein
MAQIVQMPHNQISRGKAIFKPTSNVKVVHSPAGKKRKW